jgi:hypothetical protein
MHIHDGGLKTSSKRQGRLSKGSRCSGPSSKSDIDTGFSEGFFNFKDGRIDFDQYASSFGQFCMGTQGAEQHSILLNKDGQTFDPRSGGHYHVLSCSGAALEFLAPTTTQ